MENQFIDAVITWVDGGDPDFISCRDVSLREFKTPTLLDKWRRKSRYTGRAEAHEQLQRGARFAEESAVDSGSSGNRFRSNDELRFVLRSIEAFAPWINRIYIVTNGQIPSWFNACQDKVSIVTHREIFQDSDNLPAFNSNAIEWHLRHIPGLSENFLYFNDDTFLGRPLSLSDFKDEKGRFLLFTESKKKLPLKMSDRSLVGHAWAYNHQLLNELLGPAEREHFPHTPQMYNCALLEELELIWRDEINLTKSYKFRTPFDASMRVLYTHYIGNSKKNFSLTNRHAGFATLRSIDKKEFSFVPFGDDRIDYLSLLWTSYLARPMFVCINDEIISNSEVVVDSARRAIQIFLDQYFPTPSIAEVPRDLPVSEKIFDARSSTLIDAPEISELTIAGVTGANATSRFRIMRKGDVDWVPHVPMNALVGQSMQSGDVIEILSDQGDVSIGIDFVLKRRNLERQCLRGFHSDLALFFEVPRDCTHVPFDVVIEAYHARRDSFQSVVACALPIMDQPLTYPISHFVRADRQIQTGFADGETLRHLDLALTGGVDPFWVCHRRCLVALTLKDRDLALESIRFALAINPQERRVFFDLASTLCHSKMYFESLIVADGLCEHEQLDLPSVYLRSLSRYHTEGDDPEIELLLAEADQVPHYFALWLRVQLRQRDDYDALESKVMEIKKRYPDNIDIAKSTFQFYSARGEPTRAIWALGPVLSDPEEMDFLQMIGEEIYLNRIRTVEAVIGVLKYNVAGRDLAAKIEYLLDHHERKPILESETLPDEVPVSEPQSLFLRAPRSLLATHLKR